jgi:DUF971 family protein
MRPLAITDHARSGILEIAWSDGVVSRLPHGLLRARCRCAQCEQWRRRTGADAVAAEALRIVAIEPVGELGLNLVFNDEHGRGIYPWAYLRELCASTQPTT